MNSLKNAGNFLSEKVQGVGSQSQKEVNKQVAKDNNAPVGTRMSAAKDMMHNKMDEHKHKTKADVHKEAAKH